MTKTAILWFMRDLRVADTAALSRAARAGRVSPLYVAECLAELRVAPGQLGAPLVLWVGDALEMFEALPAEHDVTQLVRHRETGNAWTFARDRRVAARAWKHAVDWLEMPNSAVVWLLLRRSCPEPIVAVKAAAAMARARVWSVRKGGGLHDEAARLADRRASRSEQGARPHYGRDRKTGPCDRQLKLDL